MAAKLLSIPEVAEQLSVGHGLVRRQIAMGKLVASKVGGLWRVRQEDVDAFLERSRPHQPKPVIAESERLQVLRPNRFR